MQKISKSERNRRRMALQEQDEIAGRKSPAIPTSISPAELERRKERKRQKKGASAANPLSSPLGRLDGSPTRGINKQASLAISGERGGKR